jgi:hypothetical protein
MLGGMKKLLLKLLAHFLCECEKILLVADRTKQQIISLCTDFSPSRHRSLIALGRFSVDI